MQKYPDYVCRVTADEGEIGRGHLSRFQELETRTPVILTTSQLLTTGVDVPTCKNIVIARVVGGMTEFKQIIGRGTRVRDDYGKLFFNILDYTGSATRLFADPEFDGWPAMADEVTIDEQGQVVAGHREGGAAGRDRARTIARAGRRSEATTRHNCRASTTSMSGQVEVVAHLVYELDPDGKQLRVVKFTDYTAEKVRTMYTSAAELRRQWADPALRADIIARLEERGISFDELRTVTNQPDADPFDLLCHVAFNAPLRTRRERADRLRKEERAFFEQYGARGPRSAGRAAGEVRRARHCSVRHP